MSLSEYERRMRARAMRSGRLQWAGSIPDPGTIDDTTPEWDRYVDAYTRAFRLEANEAAADCFPGGYDTIVDGAVGPFIHPVPTEFDPNPPNRAVCLFSFRRSDA